jgi:hypothetical protein
MIGFKPAAPITQKDGDLPLGCGRNNDIWNAIPVEISDSNGMRNESGRLMVRIRKGRRALLNPANGRSHDPKGHQGEEKCNDWQLVF